MIRRFVTPLSIAAAVVVVDLLTKRNAAINFVDTDVVVIPGFLYFTFLENPGAAFGLFRDGGQVVGVAAVLVTGFVVWMLRKERPTIERVALGLIVGGALGNISDRLFRGSGFLDGPVIDWVKMWWIPTFNIADASVTVAVVLLVISSWQTRQTS